MNLYKKKIYLNLSNSKITWESSGKQKKKICYCSKLLIISKNVILGKIFNIF